MALPTYAKSGNLLDTSGRTGLNTIVQKPASPSLFQPSTQPVNLSVGVLSPNPGQQNPQERLMQPMPEIKEYGLSPLEIIPPPVPPAVPPIHPGKRKREAEEMGRYGTKSKGKKGKGKKGHYRKQEYKGWYF